MIILVGGVPGIGKSTVSQRLAARLRIAHIQMDFVNSWYELLFADDFSALISEVFWRPREAKRLAVQGDDPVIEEAKRKFLLCSAPLSAICRAAELHGESIVVEGWTVAPGYAPRQYATKQILLTMDDRSLLRRRLLSDGKLDGRHIEPFLALYDYLVSVAQHLGVRCVDCTSLPATVKNIIRHVRESEDQA